MGGGATQKVLLIVVTQRLRLIEQPLPQTLEWAFKCSLDPIQPLGNQKIESHSVFLMCPETEAEIFSEQYW